MSPEELKVSDINGQIRLIDRSTMPYAGDKQRYNRMKPGHPSGYIEAFANLYSDIADELVKYRSKNATSGTGYVFGLDHTQRCIDFFHAANRSNRDQKWIDVG
jgi:hypothetical protein